MGSICKKLALLAIPVLLWFVFFAAFEPNNYFGFKESGASTAPIARIKAYTADPGTNLILGDSRLAHIDPAAAQSADGKQWQNLAFGGASLRETLDLAEYCLDSGNPVDSILFGLSFYTLNAAYDADRMSALEDTLRNPLAYCFNLEYNVNALTAFSDKLAGRTDAEETGDWVFPADYTDPTTGDVYDLHTVLAVYPKAIAANCAKWSLNQEQLDRLYALAARCKQENLQFTVVFPPMADNVRALCDEDGITESMAALFPTLTETLGAQGVTVLDYEWSSPDDDVWGGGYPLDNDTQYFDGFHLDTRYGLPVWTADLFGRV